MPSVSKLTLVAPGVDQPGGTLTLGEQAATVVLGGVVRLGAAGPTIRQGVGSPEGTVAADVGSLFLRTDGGAATTLYVKESGSGSTGWVAK